MYTFCSPQLTSTPCWLEEGIERIDPQKIKTSNWYQKYLKKDLEPSSRKGRQKVDLTTLKSKIGLHLLLLLKETFPHLLVVGSVHFLTKDERLNTVYLIWD